jgi:general secretion pathway protein C
MRLRFPAARLASVLLFAALCAIVAAWALQLLAPRAPIAPSGAVAQARAPADLRAAGQLFGGVVQPGGTSVAAAPANIRVAGVLAAGDRGVALLAIDGKPARPFGVGESLDERTTVRSVSADAVELSRDGRTMRLPAPARGSVAVLTSGPQRPTDGSAPPAPPSPAAPPLRPLPPAGAAAAPPPAPDTAGALPPGAPVLPSGAGVVTANPPGAAQAAQ